APRQLLILLMMRGRPPGRGPGRQTASALPVLLMALGIGSTAWAQSPRVTKAGSMSPLVHAASDLGRAGPTERHRITVGLELRNRDALEAFLEDIHDPTSTNYRRFLTQEEFNPLYGPTAADEAALAAYLEANGVHVTQRLPNRLVVGAVGSVAALERAFGVEIHAVELRGQRHYAALNEPSLPA